MKEDWEIEAEEYASLEHAVTIAFKAHFGQKRDDGTHYIFHPLAVMNSIPNDNIKAKTVAILHDILEDTTAVNSNYLSARFDPEIVKAIKLLTRIEAGPYASIPYEHYINNLKDNKLARIVKIADLKHNLSTIDNIKDPIKRIKLHDRYKAALGILNHD